MRWLITGGAGFIGSHLAEWLLHNGHHVIVLDDLSTGRMANLQGCRDDIEMVYGSVLDKQLINVLVDDVDVVVHLAAAVGVQLVVRNPSRTIKTNVEGTATVLEACAKKNKRCLIASTSEVYGLSPTFPLVENQVLTLGAPTRGRWSYAASKLLDEYLALAYHQEQGLPVTILRLFNTVGPRQTGRYGMVIPTFVRQALAGEPLTVYGSGRQTRCFCHVKDVERVIEQACLTDKTIGEVINVGSEEEIAIEDLAYRVLEVTKSSSKIEFVTYSAAYDLGFEDMPRRVPAIIKSIHLGLWQGPTVTLEAIIQGVANYQREYKHT